MFRLRFATAIAAIVIALGTLPASGSSQTTAVLQAQKLSKKELRVLIATARTPEDHERIATHYRAEAERLREKQRDHEEELAAYLKNPSSHPSPKWPTLDQHCRQLAYYYGKAAEKTLVLADLHDRMATAIRDELPAR
jgi:hypothetical protein